jgi:3-oxoacyl-[acyl-carrier protein] reductase
VLAGGWPGRTWTAAIAPPKGSASRATEPGFHRRGRELSYRGGARSLAWELGPDGILVNVVAPGLTLTERIRQTLPSGVAERFAARVPSRRLSAPEDLAGLIVFLASAANGGVSGELVREGSATGRSAHAG